MSGSLRFGIALLAMLVLATPAHAAFPGQNGKIAFSSDRDGDAEIYVMNGDGTGQTALTTNTVPDGNPAPGWHTRWGTTFPPYRHRVERR